MWRFASSLVHTCQLSGANPFDYLTELQKHAADLKGNPNDWMPWNYCATLARGDPSRYPPTLSPSKS